MERKRISAQKLSEQIAEVLEERIVGGVYAVGERLPPERQLAAEFGVSRPPLRDALGALAARQLLHSRPGGGHYVSEYVQSDFMGAWQGLLGRHEYLRDDVLDFRRSLEGTLASLAAQRRTDEDLARMGFWLAELETANTRRQVEKQSQADVGFHQSIAEAAHNILFAQLSGSLLRMLHQHTQQNLANMFRVADLKPELMAQHHALFDAIKKRQPHKAAQMAHAHIGFVEQSLKQAAEQQKRSERAAELAEHDRQRLRGR